MDNYRPDYGLPYNYPPPPPPIHAMPPLPPGPPPSYDPHRGGDSYRPRQSDFSYRNNGSAPQPPKEWEPFRPTRSRGYAMRENGRSRPGNNDNVNLNQARRRNNYRPRQNFRTAPADRPLLRHHDQANSSEEMLGMTNGQRFMAAEDISDSDEEQMDESESDLDEREINEVDLLAMREGNDTTQIVDEPHEPPSKRRALTSNSNTVTNGTSEPKWSNPDPYTVLPPVDEATRKRKDVVKLIRKARREAEEIAEEHNQVAANDDFISFGMDENAGAEPASPRMDDQNGSGRGVPGAPSGPRSFSHLHNLHSQEVPRAPEVSIQTDSANKLGPSPQTSPEFPKIPEETVLDLGRNSAQSVPAFGGDENLGNRKRTRDDSIKGQKKGSPHNNGSILHDWRPASGMDPIPWLSRTSLITANAGFRSVHHGSELKQC